MAIPRLDLHVHTLHSDSTLTVAEVARRARRARIACGICDHLSPYHHIFEANAFDAYVADVRGFGLWCGAELCLGVEIPVDQGRLDRLDYVLGGLHAVPLNGRRYYLWGGEFPDDVTAFADAYLAALVEALERTPMTVLAHPTYLPPPLDERYDEIWTPARLARLWDATAAAGVAVEISGRWRVPRPQALRPAVERGLTFSFGSDAHRLEQLFDLAYPRAMAEAFQLDEDRIFRPPNHA
jgi:histidinol phosphatase-like PHP family hydrolase